MTGVMRARGFGRIKRLAACTLHLTMNVIMDGCFGLSALSKMKDHREKKKKEHLSYEPERPGIQAHAMLTPGSAISEP